MTTGYANGTYTVNDPAGKWTQSFKGGYGWGSGNGVTYGSNAFELAISSSNGSNYLPLWYYDVIP